LYARPNNVYFLLSYNFMLSCERPQYQDQDQEQEQSERIR